MSYFMQKLECKYFTTDGRLNRKPFNIYIIIFIVASLLSISIGSIVGYMISLLQNYFIYVDSVIFLRVLPSIIVGICFLFILMVSLPLNFMMIRRLHDLNCAAWWIIMPIIIPPLYIIFILCLCIIKGKSKPNKYGNSLI